LPCVDGAIDVELLCRECGVHKDFPSSYLRNATMLLSTDPRRMPLPLCALWMSRYEFNGGTAAKGGRRNTFLAVLREVFLISAHCIEACLERDVFAGFSLQLPDNATTVYEYGSYDAGSHTSRPDVQHLASQAPSRAVSI
jgi:hypothetical protein